MFIKLCKQYNEILPKGIQITLSKTRSIIITRAPSNQTLNSWPDTVSHLTSTTSMNALRPWGARTLNASIDKIRKLRSVDLDKQQEVWIPQSELLPHHQRLKNLEKGAHPQPKQKVPGKELRAGDGSNRDKNET